MIGRWIAIGLAVAASQVPAVRAQPPRDLAVPSDKGWEHADTGIVLMSRLAGLQRSGLVDATGVERDVTATFGGDGPVVATVHIFHPAIGGVAMWFDRADTAMRLRPGTGEVVATGVPRAFAAPGTNIAGALRRTYAIRKGAYRSAASATIPLGDWLVAVNLRGRTLDPAALDALLSQTIAAIRWPAYVAPPAGPVAAIARCTMQTAYRDAHVVAPSAAGFSLNAAVAGAIADRGAPAATAQSWCRDGDGTAAYTVYRSGSADGSYTIALGDAGRSVSVAPANGTAIRSAYTAVLTDPTGDTVAYPDYDALPRPSQVVAAIAQTPGKR